jgi:orotate phosphoribosyltransferase
MVQSKMNKIELAREVTSTSLLRGGFRLRSGIIAKEYFDKYRFESDPVLLRAIAEHLVPLIPPNAEVIAGLELGGVPLATALSMRTGMPALFVRKQAKDYGTCRLAEGGEVAGRRLLLIEDVVTSGGQVLASCEQLRRLGATVEYALCVIDRCEGGAQALRAAGVELRALFTKTELNSPPSNGNFGN